MTSLDLASRPDSNAEAEAVRLMDFPDLQEDIPVLDIGPHVRGEPGGRELVARRLKEITETVGFFYLIGHGVPEGLIEETFAQARAFHTQPEDVKARVPHHSVNSFMSGYQPVKTPRAKGSNVNIISDAKPNLLSKISFNREIDGQEVNFWPENLPGFQETIAAYHQEIEKLARRFLPLWATSLDLPIDYFERFFKSPHLTLSLLHYPPQKEIGNRQYGIAPHTDNSFMTFLAQSNVPGLAVRMPSGHWKLVEKMPGAFLVNTGNLMVRWTNDRYLSTKHRVINTSDAERYSLPMFFGPSVDALIEPAPTCCSPDNPPHYEPITYGDLRKWYYGSYD